MSTLKQILQCATGAREPLQALTDRALVTRCAGLRPGPLDTPVGIGKHTLRSLARRWLTLADEITTHDRHLARLTAGRRGRASVAHTAAAMFIIFGDNPERIRSEAAFAKLCGACPVPASSGMTTGRQASIGAATDKQPPSIEPSCVCAITSRRSLSPTGWTDDGTSSGSFLAREIYQRVMRDFRTRQQLSEAS